MRHSRNSPGESEELHKPTDEVSVQQEHVTPHGCGGGVPVEGTSSGVPVAHSPRESSSDNSEIQGTARILEFEGASIPAAPEDDRSGVQDTVKEEMRNSGEGQEDEPSHDPRSFR